MAQSIGDGSVHLDRLHHHRGLVQAAHAAIDDAARSLVAAHYAQHQGAGPESASFPPEGVKSDNAPPPSN